MITKDELCGMFDHTLLKAYATDNDFEQLCKEADELGVAMVAINSAPVSLCKKLLSNSKVRVGAAISFPLGQTVTEVKLAEVKKAIEDGADEIDYVINIGDVKMHRWQEVKSEMTLITEVCKKNNVISKVIFENCYLEKDEIKQLSLIAKEVKPDFIKTSTGFGTSGAKVEDVELMKSIVGNDVKVKAAGGIRDWSTCKKMIDAGAQRIGTSSSLKIVEEYLEEQKS